MEIDTESIYRSKLPNSQIHPLSRTYISKLLDCLNTLNAGVVGLDFLFDTPQQDPISGDADLAKSVKSMVDKNTWLVFAALLEPNREVGTNEALGINKWNWTLQGYVDSYTPYSQLPDPKRNCRQVCPISYLMALTQTARQEVTDLPQPQTNRTTNLRTQLIDTIEQKKTQKGDLANLLNLKRPLGLEPLVNFLCHRKMFIPKYLLGS